MGKEIGTSSSPGKSVQEDMEQSSGKRKMGVQKSD